MSRIIRVSGCHDCPFCVIPELPNIGQVSYECDMTDFDLIVTKFKESKTLPDNCSLEKDFTEEEIEETREFLKTIPDPKPYFKSAK